MKTKSPLSAIETSELICKEFILAIFENAIEELKCHLHPNPKLRVRRPYYGNDENPLAELRLFLTSPDEGKFLASCVNLKSFFTKYQENAMPLLLQAEALAGPSKAVKKPRFVNGAFKFYNWVFHSAKKRSNQKRYNICLGDNESVSNNQYGSVDKSGCRQFDFLGQLFSNQGKEGVL